MFLHAGASLHGHEYSTRPSPHTARRNPLLRSALRPLSDAEANTKTPSPTPPPPYPRRMSFADSPCPPGARTTRPRPTSECLPPRREQVVRFAEPESEPEPETEPLVVDKVVAAEVPTSEDEGTYSECSDTSLNPVAAARKKKRRIPRSGTKFIFAQPPPRVVKRHRRFIQIRPTLILQLQQITETRPKPTFDVLPSNVLSGSVITTPGLARRFPRLFRFRRELGPNDLVLARSEDYDAPAMHGRDDAEEGNFETRELVAVISPLSLPSGDCTEIVLADGAVWTATSMANGSYEFVQEDPRGHCTTARWVRRRVPSYGEDDYKFTFSVLDPNSRRHPIMATLTSTSLEILDNYTTVSPSSSGRYPPTRSFSFDTAGTYPQTDERLPADRTTCPVDESARAIITVSSVWISLQLSGMAAATNSPAVAPSKIPASHKRSVSVTDRAATFPLSSDVIPAATPSPLNTRVVSTPVVTPSVSPSQTPPLVPKRAMSTGAAFMQRRRTEAVVTAPTEEVETADENGKKSFFTALKNALKLKWTSRAKRER